MSKSRLSLALVLLLLVGWTAQAATLPRQIKRALKEAQIPWEHVGLVVQPLDRPGPGVRLNAAVPFNPASIMKVVTTLAALDTLGPAHTFKTQVFIDGTLAAGVLSGNLVLQGGGDPALSLEHFHTLLHALRAGGLRRIEGDVILDGGYYAIADADPAAFDGAPIEPYNAIPAALSVNYNVLPLSLAPGSDGLAARLEPPVLPLENSLVATDRPDCGDWQDGVSARLDGDRLRLAGSYPAACGARTLWLNLLPPAATVAAVFAADWAELGGVLAGRARAGATPPGARPFLTLDSPPLAQIVRDTNKFSNNVMAKMLFLNLGAARCGAPATWEKGERAIREWLAGTGLRLPELVLENGSGLSRAERLSVGSVARLLTWAARQPLYYEFAASLPALGLEGTQRKHLNATLLAGRAWLKSGSLNGTRNLAGYVLDAAGRRKVVVLFINHHTDSAKLRKVQSAVLSWAMGLPSGH